MAAPPTTVDLAIGVVVFALLSLYLTTHSLAFQASLLLSPWLFVLFKEGDVFEGVDCCFLSLVAGGGLVVYGSIFLSLFLSDHVWEWETFTTFESLLPALILLVYLALMCFEAVTYAMATNIGEKVSQLIKRRKGPPETSESHPLQVDSFSPSSLLAEMNMTASAEGTPFSRAVIGMSICPGRTKSGFDRNLNTDLTSLTEEGDAKTTYNTVVTLVSQHELDVMGVSAIPEVSKELGIQWIHVPVRDKWIPECRSKFRASVLEVARLIRDDGARVLVHCNGGKGRTGLFVLCLLLELARNLGKRTVADLTLVMRLRGALRKCRGGMLKNPTQILYASSYGDFIDVSGDGGAAAVVGGGSASAAGGGGAAGGGDACASAAGGGDASTAPTGAADADVGGGGGGGGDDGGGVGGGVSTVGGAADAEVSGSGSEGDDGGDDGGDGGGDDGGDDGGDGGGDDGGDDGGDGGGDGGDDCGDDVGGSGSGDDVGDVGGDDDEGDADDGVVVAPLAADPRKLQLLRDEEKAAEDRRASLAFASAVVMSEVQNLDHQPAVEGETRVLSSASLLD